MNGDRLEHLVLSGELFHGRSRSSSPARSASSESNDHDSEFGGSWGRQVDGEVDAHSQQVDSIGMGPGRTGVKGVIRDRNEAAVRERSRKAEELAELSARMERANLGGKTFLEERDESFMLEGRQRGRFGHLREVGLSGFVPAVEEDRNIITSDSSMLLLPPVAAIKSLDRCDTIDDLLMRLARENPNTKFIRCRASAIGFALNSQSKPRSLRPPSSTYLSKSRTSPRFVHQDDDDPYGSDADEPADIDALNKDEDGDEDEEDVDTDMLPTILVYRSGQLVHNWVRVDWEAGLLGIDELLERHDIIQSIHTRGSLNVPLNDEGDLVFSTPIPDEL
ncbi:hypothetical protein V8E52_001250 [Russula decolorans]